MAAKTEPAKKVVRLNANRSFKERVKLVILDENGDEQKHHFDAFFKVKPRDELRELLKKDEQTVLEAVLVKADLEMVNDEGTVLEDQKKAMLEDPSVATALMATYREATERKNGGNIF